MNFNCSTAKQIFGPGRLALNVAVVGLNHLTAPIEVREMVAVKAGWEHDLLLKLAKYASEVMLVATCNRTEIYLVGLKGSPEQAFLEVFGASAANYLYVHKGNAAINHLCRVTAGLDSLIIGETQIQGQVKKALQKSVELGLSGTLLNKIVQSALATGKRIRSETTLVGGVVSISAAAVELAITKLASLQDKNVLIIGAGETAELCLTHLVASGIAKITIANRTLGRAEKLAEKFGGEACGLAELAEKLPTADLVIAASASGSYLLQAKDLTASREMLLIDISLPRAINPDIDLLERASLYNLDDLHNIVNKNIFTRKAAIPHAEAIIREGVSEFRRWCLTREALRERAALAGD